MRGFFGFLNGVMWLVGIILAFAAGVFVEEKMAKETQTKKLKNEGANHYFNGAEAALAGELSLAEVKPGIIHLDTYDKASPARGMTRIIRKEKNQDLYEKIREKL
jgi:gas vesicle protein